MVCGGECPSLEAGLAQTNTQLRETGVLTVATVLMRSRVFTTSRALIAPHVVAPCGAPGCITESCCA